MLFYKKCNKCTLGEIEMQQVLICLKKKKGLYLGVLDTRQKELVALGNAIRAGNTYSIATRVKKALDAGAPIEEILKVLAFIVGDERLLSSIMEILSILRYENDRRAPWISVVDDVREE